MIKYVAISLIAIFLMACTGNKNSYFSEEEKEEEEYMEEEEEEEEEVVDDEEWVSDEEPYVGSY